MSQNETKSYSAKKAAQAAAIVLVASFVSKITGFARELLIGIKFGATWATDAYLVSLTVPGVIFAVIADSLSTTFIPVYSEIDAKKGKASAIKFAGNLFNVVFFFAALLSVFGAVFAKPIVKIVAMGFTGETLTAATSFTRITMFMCIFVGMSKILTGFLQTNQQFAVPAIIGIPYNLMIIAALLFSSRFGIWGLVTASVAAAMMQVVIQIPAARSNGFVFRGGLDFREVGLRRMAVLVMPVVLGTGVGQINTLVDRMLASGLPEGSIAALNFANRLNGFAFGLFTLSVATVIYPTLSMLSAEGDIQGFKNALGRAMGIVIAVILPMTAGAVLLREPIIRLLFERGAFDSRATQMTATALLYYSPGMVGFGLRDVLSRGFYSLQDTKTPMINGIAAMIVNIILNLVLVRFMGLGGLALATSISAIFGTVLLLKDLRRKVGPIGGKKIATSMIKSCAACVAMSIVVLAVYSKMKLLFPPVSTTSQALDVFVTVFGGAAAYFAACLILRVEEVFWLLKLLKRKGKTSRAFMQ